MPPSPRGSRLFHFDKQNFRDITASEVHAPPPTRLTPPYRKSWIRHCFVDMKWYWSDMNTFQQKSWIYSRRRELSEPLGLVTWTVISGPRTVNVKIIRTGWRISEPNHAGKNTDKNIRLIRDYWCLQRQSFYVMSYLWCDVFSFSWCKKCLNKFWLTAKTQPVDRICVLQTPTNHKRLRQQHRYWIKRFKLRIHFWWRCIFHKCDNCGIGRSQTGWHPRSIWKNPGSGLAENNTFSKVLCYCQHVFFQNPSKNTEIGWVSLEIAKLNNIYKI